MHVLYHLLFVVSFAATNYIANCRPMKREITKSAENPCKSGGQRDLGDSQKLAVSPVDVRSSNNITSSSPSHLPEVMHELAKRCQQAEIKATQYAQVLEARMRSKDLINSLNKTHVHAFSFLGTNNTDNMAAGMDQTQKLEMDFRHLGSALVYLKQISKDELQKESGLHMNDLTELQKNVTYVYCLLQGIGNFVYGDTSDVMPPSERNTSSRADRFRRDYVFVTDLVELLKIKEQSYLKYQTTLVG